MKAIWAIAINTFREVVRNRIFFVLILIACGLTSLVLAMGSVSLNQEKRVVIDLGLFLISTLTVVMSILLSGSMVHKELERKTIYTILSKPIHRYEFLLGKYVGNVLISGLMVAVLGSLLAGCLVFVGGALTATYAYAVWFVWVEVMVITAVSIFFISFSSPILSGSLALGVFITGRFVPTLLAFKFEDAQAEFGTLEDLVHLFARIVPDLSLFNLTPNLVYDLPTTFGFVRDASLSGFAYIGICLCLASVFFGRRDLT